MHSDNLQFSWHADWPFIPYAILSRSRSCGHYGHALKYLQGVVRTVSYGVRANCGMNESNRNINYLPT